MNILIGGGGECWKPATLYKAESHDDYRTATGGDYIYSPYAS